MSQFRNWYVRNQDAINWFIIGWLTLSCLESLVKGDFIWAAVYAVIAYVNVKLRHIRM
jgi:hypothetical protein